MKKTILAAALLSAMAFTAQAANVTMYGSVDAGFNYLHTKSHTHGYAVKDLKENSFKLANGLDGANKIGFKGEEDIGNAKIGFKLENQFTLTDGEFKDSKKLFSREAQLYVRNEFGEISAGRIGGLASAAGSYDIFFAEADAFDGGDNAIPYAFVTSDRYDNSLVYQTPEISGFQGTVMYSFNKNDKQQDKFKDNDRYIGAGLSFKQDALALVGVVEAQLRDRPTKDFFHFMEYKNGYTFNLGGNYDFGVAKVFAGAQIARHANVGDIQDGVDMKAIAKKAVSDANVYLHQAEATVATNALNEYNDVVDDINILFDDNHKVPAAADIDDFEKSASKLADQSIDLTRHVQVNGQAFTIGAQVPFGSNLLTTAAYLGHYKQCESIEGIGKEKIHTYGVSARLEHFLSKRSTLYVGAGIGQSKLKGTETLKHDIGQVYFGLHHNF